MKQEKVGIVARARPYLSTVSGQGIFGSGKGELLAAVEKYGSLRKAAMELGRSYRQAWGDINRAEKYLGFPLVLRSRGGSKGGTMVLTERGSRFLHSWQKHCTYIADAVEQSYKKYISNIITQTEGAN